ncbi:MAG TPA: hypothetical protein VEX68_01890 [Bryobacteraceae bacterium]|nr:hypothetical protein [Bryobacteraceae bacterium]
MMTDEELEDHLNKQGYKIGSSALSDDGMILRNINGTYMFRLDAVDLARGAATLEEIVKRNKDEAFPDAPAHSPLTDEVDEERR